MESAAIKDPKDNKIINKDDSMTNIDGGNYLEKGGQPNGQTKLDEGDTLSEMPENYREDICLPSEDKSADKDNKARKWVL